MINLEIRIGSRPYQITCREGQQPHYEALTKIINEKIAKKCDFKGTLTIYGEASRLSAATLAREGIVFKQTPYEVKARK